MKGKNTIYKSIRRQTLKAISYVSPKWNTCLWYREKFGRKLDLEHPVTLNEKLLKRKLEQYGKDETVRMCADKYAVREYITKLGYPEILNELYASYDSVEEIDWENLPEAFVMKWNFGCGYNLICPKKTRLDIQIAEQKMRKWGQDDFWAYFSELQYRNVKKKIIVEKYLQSEKEGTLEDYKFYCFGGKAECVMVCYGRNSGWPKFFFFDRDWNLLRINPDSKKAPEGFSLPKPEGIDRAFVYADCLSGGFDFVRTDLYLVDGKVYFGEYTFTPAAALDNNRLPETDRMFGGKLE
ncbi:MAG: ATP-grasp fold amidoligase family protein [Hespellia sp.]|nr:ATP-grasp fold amidoligase family protein [Hespellia sp.]